MNTLPGLVRNRMTSDAARTILRRKDRGIWKPTSWAELGASVRALARALQADGFGQGMVGAILADTRPEWLQADLAVQAVGGASAGLSPLSGANELAAQMRSADVRWLFVENEEQLDKVLEARDACPMLCRIVIFEMKGLRGLNDPMCVSFGEYVTSGGNAADTWNAAIDSLDPDAPAAVVYAQDGTDALCPVHLSHRALATVIEAATRLFAPRAADERLAVMPLAHVSERVLGAYLSLHANCISNFGESAGTLEENLREVQPTVLVAAPSLWKRFHDRIELAAAAATRTQRTLFRMAFAAGAVAGANRTDGRHSAAWRAAAACLARPVLANVRRDLGLSRLRLGLIAGGAVAPELVRWFMALNIDPIEVYGPAESGGFAAAPAPGAIRPGDAGYPIAPELLRISPQGTVELSTASMQPSAADTQSGLAWHDTGDVGVMTDGRLTVLGKLADMVAPVGNAPVHPGPIERALCLSPYIADALVVGDGQAFLGCLLLLHADTVEGWAHARRVTFGSFAELVDTEQVRTLLQTEIDRVNKAAAQASPIRAFRAIDRRLQDGDPELTPLGGLRRVAAMTAFRALIAAMYNETTQSARRPVGEVVN